MVGAYEILKFHYEVRRQVCDAVDADVNIQLSDCVLIYHNAKYSEYTQRVMLFVE